MPANAPIGDWHGKLAWLVGASTGIGRATAALLHTQGARVIVSARNATALGDFVAAHPGSQALPLDVTDHDALRAAATQIVAQHGGIDLAFYCAGIYTPMRATAFDLDTALRHQQVNYVGALHLLDAVLPTLLAQTTSGPDRSAGSSGSRGGHISLVSSVAGYRGLPQALAYGPTKAALISLAQTLYLDLQDHGIGVSVINPGYVDTPATAGNDYHMPALISAEEAAREIARGWQRGDFEIHFPKRFTRSLKALQLLGVVADRLTFRAIRKVTGL